MLRTLLMGFVALVSLVAVLAAVFLVGLLRIHLADRPQPIASVASPASRPTATAPSFDPPVDPDPDPLPPVTIQAIELPAEKARLNGSLKLDKDAMTYRSHSHRRSGQPPDPPPVVRLAITNFHEESDIAEWSTTISTPGVYEVDLVYASPGSPDKSEACTIDVGDQQLHADTLHTRGRDSYQVLTVGNLTLSPGNLTIRFRLSETSRGSQLRLRTLRLIPAT